MKKKYLIALLSFFCCFYSFSFSGAKSLEEAAIPNIRIDRVSVEAVCNDVDSYTYNFKIDLCSIHTPNGNPVNFHAYIRPVSSNTWEHIGVPVLVDSNELLYELSFNTSTQFSVETWIMQGFYNFVNPAAIDPWFGYDFCASHRLFDMPEPTGDCDQSSACDCINGGEINNTVNMCHATFSLSGFGVDGCATLIQEFTWNFGDNSPEVVTSGFPINTEHTYSANGTYNVTVSFNLEDNVTGELCEVTYEVDIEVTDCEGCTADEVTITANEVHDISDSLTYTVICGQNCVLINATNIENAVYNTSDPVLNDLQGTFCFGDDIQSFVVDITGTDSCGDPYMEQVTIIVEQDCPEIECCEGESNILDNGNFEQATCGGNGAFNNGCVPNWTDTERTPSINGFGTNPYAWMWSYSNRGEGITTDFNFEEGETYTICFRIRADDKNSGDPNVANNATINFVATNTTGDIVANPTGDFIFHETMGPYLNAWTNVSVEFTPTADFSSLWIYPYMADPSDGVSQAELSVDDISICCPEKDLIIEPYWQHPNCPEVVCDAEEWPVHILDSDDDPITSAGGITISWDNLDTVIDENILADWIYVSPTENWQATITYPNGCEYIITYVEYCCEDDIYINVIECPTEEQLAAYEAQLNAQYLAKKDNNSKRLLALLNSYIQKRALGEGCDPCEEEIVFIELVDGEGDVINDSQNPDSIIYDSLIWSDGGSGAMRAFPLPMSGEVCFTATKTNDFGYLCTYTDCFLYECEDDCEITAPTNLQVSGANLTWDPVPGAVSYIVSSPSIIKIECCRVNGVSMAPITTPTNSVTLSTSLQSRCFVWQVTAVCEDGTTSPVSQQACHLPTKLQDDEIKVDKRIFIYPNPSKGHVDIKVDFEDNADIHLDIYRHDGFLVKTINKSRIDSKAFTFGLDLNLPAGLYLFNFKTSDGIITKRVIIE